MIVRTALILVLLASAHAARAAGATELQAALAQDARAADPAFGGFSAARGAAFYRERHGGEWSCSSCHMENPLAAGRHALTNKPIQPLAPAANAQRFTDPAKTEKWFRRNCKDVLGRACTAQEKGDFVAWLLSANR